LTKLKRNWETFLANAKINGFVCNCAIKTASQLTTNKSGERKQRQPSDNKDE